MVQVPREEAAERKVNAYVGHMHSIPYTIPCYTERRLMAVGTTRRDCVPTAFSWGPDAWTLSAPSRAARARLPVPAGPSGPCHGAGNSRCPRSFQGFLGAGTFGPCGRKSLRQESRSAAEGYEREPLLKRWALAIRGGRPGCSRPERELSWRGQRKISLNVGPRGTNDVKILTFQRKCCPPRAKLMRPAHPVPQRNLRPASAHGSKRYPMPCSVSRCTGLAGSCSSFRLNWAR